MKVGSLFSGIGGFDLGLVRAGMEIAWQVEIDDFCQKVLKKHASEYWPNAKLFGDIKNVTKKELEPVELICGGFPCQPFSSAGKRRGKEDDRYLWPEMLRVIRELSPRWIIGENVTGFINMELENAFTDLETEGYKVEAFVLPANALGAPHKRDRIWIVAYSHKIRNYQCISPCDLERIFTPNSLKQWDRWASKNNRYFWWESFSDFLRVDDGLSAKLDKNRIGAIGNAVVPQIPEILGRCIMEIEDEI